ncbi:MAG TPA: hypothetical protein VEF04_21490 [Blastocatellia bacterium]|nr:hypothetical protein [Blastocatellia bacterium]
MKACCIKPESKVADNLSQTDGAIRRFINFSKWIVPSAILALLPKCPLCLSAYIAMGTGFSLSITSAGILRMLLMTVAVLSLAFLTTRLGWRLICSRTKPL